jgi:hypothetical protein
LLWIFLPTITTIITMILPSLTLILCWKLKLINNQPTSPHHRHCSANTFLHFTTPPSLSSQYISPPSISYITTHIQSHPHTYTDCIALNSPLGSTHNTKFLLQQLLQGQQTCIHAISNLVTDISTLNQSLTPPNYTHHFPDQLCASPNVSTNNNHTQSLPFPIQFWKTRRNKRDLLLKPLRIQNP